MQYLRNKRDGFIYEWHEILAANPLCEEVTEEQAFPERFMKPEVVEEVRKARIKRKGALDMSTELPAEPDMTLPELAAEAARGMP
jgi:ATP sulfurylase